MVLATTYLNPDIHIFLSWSVWQHKTNNRELVYRKNGNGHLAGMPLSGFPSFG